MNALLLVALLVAADAPLVPACEGGVLGAFAPGGARVARKGKVYEPPTAAMLDALAGSIRAMLDGDPRAAAELAIDAEYAVCRGSGEESDLTLWHPISSAVGHAAFVVRSGDA